MSGGAGSLLGGWRLVGPFARGAIAIDFTRMKCWMAGHAQTNDVYEYDLPARGSGLDPNLWPIVEISAVIPGWWPAGEGYCNGLVWWGGKLWCSPRVFYAQGASITAPLTIYATDGSSLTFSNLPKQAYSGFVKVGPGADPYLGGGGYESGQGTVSGPTLGTILNASLITYQWPELPGAGDPPANWNLRAPRPPNYFPVNNVDSWVAWNPRDIGGTLEGRWASDRIRGGGLVLPNGINYWAWLGTGVLDYAIQTYTFAWDTLNRTYVYRYDSAAFTFIDYTEAPWLGWGPILGQELDSDGNVYLCHGEQWTSGIYQADNIIEVYSGPSSGGGGGGGGSTGPGGSNPPANINAATAIVIGDLPYTNEQETADGVTAYEVWYKYTGVLGQLAIQVIVENTNPGGSSYVPDITFYEADGVTEILVPNIVTPAQIGTLAVTDYYIKVSPNVADITTSPLRITVNRNTTAPIYASYILINDDGQSGASAQGHLPGVIINSTLGEVANIVFPLAQGDYGDILPNGVIALENFREDDIVFYDPDFDVRATVDLSASTDFIKIRANNSLGVFAVSHRQGGVTKFKIFDDTGAQLSNNDTTLLQNPQSIALLNDNDTMLYSLQVGGSPISMWTLSTNTAAGDLIAGVGAYRVADILVLDNGDILALYVLGANPVFVRSYTSAGVLQQTYTIGNTIYPNGAIPRMGYDANGEQTAFWVWWFPSTGVAQADKINILDGSVLQTFQVDTYEGGISDVANPEEFGPSNSCPIIVLGTNNEITTTGSNDDETVFVNQDEEPPVVLLADGIYEMIPGKTDDTIWIDVVAGTTIDVKIP